MLTLHVIATTVATQHILTDMSMSNDNNFTKTSYGASIATEVEVARNSLTLRLNSSCCGYSAVVTRALCVCRSLRSVADAQYERVQCFVIVI